jgi:hypothetical protein
MCRRKAAMVAGSACTRTGGRLRAPAGHAVGQQADGQHVVQVGMGDQDVVDAPSRRA